MVEPAVGGESLGVEGWVVVVVAASGVPDGGGVVHCVGGHGEGGEGGEVVACDGYAGPGGHQAGEAEGGGAVDAEGFLDGGVEAVVVKIVDGGWERIIDERWGEEGRTMVGL